MNRCSNAFAYDEKVDDDFIVEYILTIPEHTLRYATERCAERTPNVFRMKGVYNDSYYDFILHVDDLPVSKKLRLFNHEKNFALLFKKKELVLLDVILSSNRIEYPQQIPMLESYDKDVCKSLLSWVVSTRKTNETILNMLGEHFNFFRDLESSERIELKKHFWDSAISRNPHEPFYGFPTGGTESMVLFNGIMPLITRYNSLFGMERIESDGWTREDIDVMVEFVREYQVSPYFISHELRNKELKGQIEIYKACLESEGTYLAFKDIQKARVYVTWDIPKEVFEDREFANFMNKMKLKYGVT